ncbi:MAG: recombinase family protein [Bacteriovoracaceae bacterium]|nr:recombinase family protein [Bacteriovoracaceae bacterium]
MDIDPRVVKGLDKKYVALYARTSVAGKQEKGLDAQVRALRRYCQEKEITNYAIFEDEGISGTKDSRPALNKMMQEVMAGRVEKVVVYSFSRYARSTTHLLNALTTFKKVGVSFLSLSENLDTNTPLGLTVYTIISALAQLERDLISERVRNGLRAAKERGVKVGRKKIRPSQLIRTLRKSGLTYKSISAIAKVSQGAIATELKEWKKEKAEGNEQIFPSDIPAPEVIAPPKVDSQEIIQTPVAMEVRYHSGEMAT